MDRDPSQPDLAEWVRLYTLELYTWAYHKISDRQLAEDLVQETFLSAEESSAAYKGESQPKTWLMGILKNKIADHYHKSLRHNTTTSLPPDEISAFFSAGGGWRKTSMPQPWQSDTEDLSDIPAFNQVLDGCIEHLSPVMDACVRLKFLDEKKGKQICQELGLTSTNYWQLIHRAKLQLRDYLENTGPKLRKNMECCLLAMFLLHVHNSKLCSRTSSLLPFGQ